MPTILTPQGWVKVAPAPRKRQTNHDPKAALRGPLAYLSCQRNRSPNINVGGGNVKGKAQFPYDLSATPETLKRQGYANAQTASRTVSAPVIHGALHPNDEDEDENSENEIEVPPSPKSEILPLPLPLPKSKSKSRTSRHPDDDNHSIASSSSSSTASSSNSYPRHRPVEARLRPPPVAPSNHYYAAPRNDHYAAPPPPPPRYDHYAAPPPPPPISMPMSMPPTSRRSLSYSWYNATTPLNFN